MRVFSQIASGRLLPKLGAYSRIATFGHKEKEGDSPVDFSVATFGQMMDNWVGRGDPLAMCLDHESAYSGTRAPAAAFFDSLALFADGVLTKFVTLDSTAINPGGLDDDGNPRNGLYARLAKITPLGADHKEGLANYACISPFFSDQGKAEDGSPIGYEILDIAATNTPFQAGCQIAFHKTGAKRASRGKSMDPELMKRLGLDDDATPDQMAAAMKACMKKYDDDIAALKKKFDDGDDTAMDKDDDKDKPSDGQSYAADATPEGIMDDGDDGAAMDAGDAMKKMSRELGCDAKPKAIFEALKLLKLSHAPKSEIAKMSRQIAELKAARAADDKKSKTEEAKAFAKQAVADGRWNPKEESDLVEARMDNPKLAEKALLPRGTWTALQRYTRGGEIVGKEIAPPEDFAATSVEDVTNASASEEAHKYAREHKVDFATALGWVAANKPHLYRRSAR